MKSIALVLSLTLLPHLAVAQTNTAVAEGEGDKLRVPSWAKGIVSSFGKPLHPIVGGVASGGGLGAGVGYDSPDDQAWYQNAEAMVTMRRYWSVQGEVGRRSQGGKSQLGAFGGVRHMNRIDYFGLGPHSAFEDQSVFRLRDTTFGARGWHHVTPLIRLGGSAAMYLPDVGPGRHPRVPSIEEVFSESSAPGFSAEPTFGRYRGFAELVYPVLTEAEDVEVNRYGATYQVAAEAVRDHDTGHHSFHRWEGEVQQRIPGIRRGERLTLHGFVATTNSGADVPFYMLYTLGGSGGLKAFRPDLIGTDGTRATLRGFRSYRFRDRDLVLMQAEYRVPLHRKVHATVFVDSGQVAPRPSELFKDLRTSTGFSLAYVNKGKSVGRVDVGFGGEGVHVLWTFGSFQN